MRRSFHPVSIFLQEPYSGLIAYPRPAGRGVAARLAELEGLGVSRVAFWGSVRLGRVDVLGKGYVGVVVLARRGGRTVALKMRRADSQRASMSGEARLLGLANRAGVGPKLIAASRNFLAMEYLDGEKIGKWAEGVGASAVGVKVRIRKVLEDCYRLDAAGIDHGELSSISKHVIMGKKTTMVDFESASTGRRAANVTAATQGMFIGSGISRGIGRAYRLPRRERIISVLREYKRKQDRESFDGVLRALGLQDGRF